MENTANLLKSLFISTAFAQFIIIGIPILFLLYYNQLTNPKFKSFLLGVSLSIFTGLKLIPLSFNIKSANIQIIFGILIFVITETCIRLFFRWKAQKDVNPVDFMFMIFAYICTKLLTISIFNIFSFIAHLNILSSSGDNFKEQALYLIENSNLIIWGNIFNSFHIYIYSLLLLLFLILSIRNKKVSIIQELIFISIHATYLFSHSFLTKLLIISTNSTIVIVWQFVLIISSIFLSISILHLSNSYIKNAN